MELRDTGVQAGARAGVGLPAHEAPWAHTLRADPHALATMAAGAGGPFHVLHPATFADNVRAFQNALLAAGVTGQVCYGKKANRSACFARACRDTGAGVDVASGPELVAALAAGIPGPDIVVTGPAKATALLELAARHQALLAVDGLDELRRVIALAHDRAGRPPARILLRVLPPTDPASRFGFDDDELARALDLCAETKGLVETEGFSFHLSGYEPAPRATLAASLIQRCLQARARGLTASTISIGGGFAVDYVPAEPWTEFLEHHDEGWYHAGHRPPTHYPYHRESTGAEMLTAILAHPTPDAATLAEALIRADVRLILEPGRALLDRAGFTVFGVQGYKTRTAGGDTYGIVTVDGLSMSLSEQWKNSEFLPDPILWPQAAILDPVRACIGGASCLEYDMLTWRKISFDRSPQHGDLLVYPNTAGYQMDKNETEFHQLPLPRRFVIEFGPDGFPTWTTTVEDR